VATCSADQRIKIFRKNIDGQWEPETEWKVCSDREFEL
jgi:nucleoporin SEH1